MIAIHLNQRNHVIELKRMFVHTKIMHFFANSVQGVLTQKLIHKASKVTTDEARDDVTLLLLLYKVTLRADFERAASYEEAVVQPISAQAHL